MDRQIVYVGAIPRSVDQLQQSKNAMIGLGMALQALLGTGTVVDGLTCSATSPAGMTVNVGPGSIYSQQNVDNSAYGILPADTTDQIIKQGIVLGTTNFSCPAPATTGQSIVYLIEAAYEDSDTGAAVLPYYNASNPSQAYNGPANSGTSQNTVRQGVCLLQVKAGTAATTGTQSTPAPDAGFTGLYAITVANGQTTITSGNISQLSTAPFINPKLPALPAYEQSGAATYAVDTSGSANTIVASLTPAITPLTQGMPFRIKVANTSTGPVVMNLNGVGNIAVFDSKGLQVNSRGVLANTIYSFTYDGTNIVMQSAGSSNSAIAGTRKNLKIVTTSNTSSTITADALVLQDMNGNTIAISSLNQSYSTGASGIGGLDTGSLAANSWYNEYVIYNPTYGYQRTILSLNPSQPLLPSGYTFYARVGAILTDGSMHLYWKIQFDRDAQNVVGTNPTGTRVMANGVGGNPDPTTPTYVQINTTLFAPPTAAKIKLGLEVSGGALVHAIVAPNANYGGITTANVFLAQTNQAVSGSGGGVVADMLLESQYIYYASDASAASLQCLGWTDNL